MGTSLTPDFWRLFAVLLLLSATLTFVLSTVLDALYVRRLRRQQDRRPTARAEGSADRPSDAPGDGTRHLPSTARRGRAPHPPRRTPAHR
ncbi:hypothetical protein [Streptomyces sp. SP18BB07]|uniref:hypothetical protein n=1 Tax=Streptomyces sp. SP18BB07 TaxID=3002522 RepID=UPI002E769B8D|nr:hypothetical protein [Streptomyces sp. SP18BB07]MEE1759207.1 hypothetical protein [Streptomyces sp. SP18BB07]